MKELFDFVDDSLSGQTDPAEHENSQHWLDSHYPFKGYSGESQGTEEDGHGEELLEKPGINGFDAVRMDRAAGE